ncbi:MAG: response regulator [Phycisphaeraceae bacterium]
MLHTMTSLPHVDEAALNERAVDLFQSHRQSILTSTDRMFTPLLILHYLAGVGLALWLTPRTWIGESSQTHIHVIAAVVLNLLVVAPAVLLTIFRPGWFLTRHVTVAVLMFQSALLIHLTGGRIETHFHVFATLALVAFYRDWRPLMTATAVVAVDHFVRGVWYPQSVYGVLAASPFRWIEHAAWVLLEVSFLMYACHRSKQEMLEIAIRRAGMEEQISRREQMHETLRTQADRLRMATSAGELGLWDWLVPEEEVFFNEQYYRMLGYAPDAFKPSLEAWKQLIHPDDLERAVQSVQDHFEQRMPRHDVEIRLRHAEGHWHWVRAVGEVVARDPQGQPLRLVGLHVSIDREKQNSQALAEARDAAEAASRAKSEFLANMSHEIRTPINGVVGTLDLIHATDLTEQQERYVDAARTSADTLLSLINDILDFSKIEAQQLELDAEPFNLEMMIEQGMTVLTQRAQLKDLELAFSIAPDVNHAVVGDEGRLRQILMNLTNNAIKFTERGEVVVTVEVEADHEDAQIVRFKVRDTGVGIPQSKQHRLFKSFSQADSSMSRKYGGTGLGLAICKQLCALMGGQIGFESIEHLGSVFTFTVTLVKQPREATTSRVVPAQLEGQRILIVDDNATSRQMLHELATQWRFDVAVAKDATEAWASLEQAADEHPFTLALVDMVMPVEDGLSLCKRIRSDRRFNQLKLLLCSSHSPSPSQAAIVEAGCNGIINKPIGPSRLFDAMMQVMVGRFDPRERGNGQLKQITAPKVTSPDAAPVRGRVLVAEDNEINRMVINDLLVSRGLDVVVVEDGRQAVEAVSTQAFDLVFMDCQMPEMDGFEATRTIHELHQAGHLATRPFIIALTANAMTGDRELCLSHGMDDYLSKPIERNRLFSTIDHWLGQCPLPPADAAAASETSPARTSAPEPLASTPSAEPEVEAPDPAIDVPELFQRCLNKVALAKRVLKTFETTSREEVDALGTSLSTGDFEAARLTAHKLKGGAAQISAMRVSDLAAAIEQLTTASAQDGWQDQMEQLQSEVSRLFAAMPEILHALDELDQPAADEGDGTEDIKNKDAVRI